MIAFLHRGTTRHQEGVRMEAQELTHGPRTQEQGHPQGSGLFPPRKSNGKATVLPHCLLQTLTANPILWHSVYFAFGHKPEFRPGAQLRRQLCPSPAGDDTRMQAQLHSALAWIMSPKLIHSVNVLWAVTVTVNMRFLSRHENGQTHCACAGPKPLAVIP